MSDISLTSSNSSLPNGPSAHLQNSNVNDPNPSSNSISGITTKAQTDFLDTFQEEFNLMQANKHIYGGQIQWVRKTVLSPFIREFGPISAGVDVKIDRYFRNHSKFTRTATTSRRASPTTKPSVCAIHWTRMMADEKKDMIETRMNELCAEAGVTSKGDYLVYYAQARQEIADSLSPQEIEKYQKDAVIETARRKAKPTLDTIFERQENMMGVLSDALCENFGWDSAQFGDVVGLLVVAYRGKKQNIVTDFSFASNLCMPARETRIPEALAAFRENVSPIFTQLADTYLPRHDSFQHRSLLNPENMAPNALRDALMNFICSAWLESGDNIGSRVEDNLPWTELKTPNGRHRYLTSPADFESLGFENPKTSLSVDWLINFAKQLAQFHMKPLFLKTTSAQPSALEPDLEPDLHTSPAQAVAVPLPCPIDPPPSPCPVNPLPLPPPPSQESDPLPSPCPINPPPSPRPIDLPPSPCPINLPPSPHPVNPLPLPPPPSQESSQHNGTSAFPSRDVVEPERSAPLYDLPLHLQPFPSSQPSTHTPSMMGDTANQSGDSILPSHAQGSDPLAALPNVVTSSSTLGKRKKGPLPPPSGRRLRSDVAATQSDSHMIPMLQGPNTRNRAGRGPKPGATTSVRRSTTANARRGKNAKK